MAAGTFDRGAMTAGEVGRGSQAIADLVAGDFDLDVDALAVGEHNAEEHDAAEHDAEELDSEERKRSVCRVVTATAPTRYLCVQEVRCRIPMRTAGKECSS